MSRSTSRSVTASPSRKRTRAVPRAASTARARWLLKSYRAMGWRQQNMIDCCLVCVGAATPAAIRSAIKKDNARRKPELRKWVEEGTGQRASAWLQPYGKAVR